MLKVWSAWGEEQQNVQLSMRSLDDYFLPGESSLYIRSRRRSKKSSRHKSRHITHCRCHNRRGCVECSRLRSLEQLVKLVVSQERKIQEIGDRIYDTDVLIGRHESRIHNHRVQQNGLDYVQDSYLNSHSSESGSSMDRLSFTSLDLKDMGDAFPGSSRHELEEISRMCNDLAHVERRLEEERAKIQRLAPEVEELSRKMGVAAELEGETNSELEETRTEMIRAVTLHVTNEYNERELDRKIDGFIHLLSKKMELYRELKDEVDVLYNSTEDDTVKHAVDKDLDDEVFLPKVQNFPASSVNYRHPLSADSKNIPGIHQTMTQPGKDRQRLFEPSRDGMNSVQHYVNLDNVADQQSSLATRHQAGVVSPDQRASGQKKTVTFASDKNVVSSFSDQDAVISLSQSSPASSPESSSFSRARANLSGEAHTRGMVNERKGAQEVRRIDNPEVEKTSLSRQPRSPQHLKDGLKIRSRSADRSSGHHRDRSPGPRHWGGADTGDNSAYLSTHRDYSVNLVNQYGMDLATLPGHPQRNNATTSCDVTRFENETVRRAGSRGDTLLPRENTDSNLPPSHKQNYHSTQSRDFCEQSEQSSRGVTNTLDRPSGQGKQGEQQPFHAHITNNRILTNSVSSPRGDSILNTQRGLLPGIKDSSVVDHNKERLFDHSISQSQKPGGGNNGERTPREGANIGARQRSALSARVVGDSADGRDLAPQSARRPDHESHWNNAGLSSIREAGGRRENNMGGGNVPDGISHVNHEVSPTAETPERFSHRNDGRSGPLSNNEHVGRTNGNSSNDSGPEYWNNFVNSDLYGRYTYYASEAARARYTRSTPPNDSHFKTGARPQAGDVHENNTHPYRVSATASDDESATRISLFARNPEQEQRRGSVDALGDRAAKLRADSSPNGMNHGNYNSLGVDNSSRGALYHIVTSKLNRTAEQSPKFTNTDSSKTPRYNLMHLNSPPQDISSGQRKLIKHDNLAGQQMSGRTHGDVNVNLFTPATLHQIEDSKGHWRNKGNNPGFHDHANSVPGCLPFRPNGTVTGPANTVRPAHLFNGHIGVKQDTHKESTRTHQNHTSSKSIFTGKNTVNLKDIPANQKNGGGSRGHVSSSRNHGNAVVGRTKVEDSNDSNSDTGLSSMHSDETANLVTLV